MKLEPRYQIIDGQRRPRHLLFIAESKEESELFDAFFGEHVTDDGLIAKVHGEVKLSDGYAEHYLAVEANQGSWYKRPPTRKGSLPRSVIIASEACQHGQHNACNGIAISGNGMECECQCHKEPS